MINIIMLALFVEAIVSAIKPLWKDGGKGLSVTEIVSIVVGVVMAVALRIDLFRVLVESDVMWDAPPWVDYIFYVMTGVAIGRGPSFIYDLWENIKKWADIHITEAVPATLEEVTTVERSYEYGLSLESWSVAHLRDFCNANDVPSTGCVTKDDYIHAITFGWYTEKPPEQGAEAEKD